jgi:hypothetical protein
MGEFFRGFQRKLGLASLLTSLAFMGCWMRSVVKSDEWVLCPKKANRIDRFLSKDGALVWVNYQAEGIIVLDTVSANVLVSYADIELGRRRHSVVRIPWQMRWWGFGNSEEGLPARLRCTIQIVPYWFIVFVMTVVSAFLLLFGPRPSDPETAFILLSRERG